MATAPCWVVSEGHAGMENQALGVAEALGLEFEVKRLRPRAPWTWLPAGWWPAPLKALAPDSDGFAPPWPKLLLTSGRRSVPYSLLLGRLAPQTYRVHLQNPQCRLERIDLVVPPAHDGLVGANVLPTVGAPNRITAQMLAQAASHFQSRFAHLPRPLLAVLVGGSNKHYRLGPEHMRELGRALERLAREDNFGLAVTPSRRTGAENLAILQQTLAPSGASIWDFQGENPYLGMLALADHLLVTTDSVSMASEAVSTGKPVHLIELAGGHRRFDKFHADLQARGWARPFDGQLESWAYEAPREAARVADEIRQRLAAQSLVLD